MGGSVATTQARADVATVPILAAAAGETHVLRMRRLPDSVAANSSAESILGC